MLDTVNSLDSVLELPSENSILIIISLFFWSNNGTVLTHFRKRRKTSALGSVVTDKTNDNN